MKQIFTFQNITKLLLMLLIIFWTTRWYNKYYEYKITKKKLEKILDVNYRIKLGLPIVKINIDEFTLNNQKYFEQKINEKPLVEFAYFNNVEENKYTFIDGRSVIIYYYHDKGRYEINNSTSQIENTHFENVIDSDKPPYLDVTFEKDPEFSNLRKIIKAIEKENKYLFRSSIYYNTDLK